MHSCCQLLNEQRQPVSSAVELMHLQSTKKSLERKTWGEQEKGQEITDE